MPERRAQPIVDCGAKNAGSTLWLRFAHCVPVKSLMKDATHPISDSLVADYSQFWTVRGTQLLFDLERP